VSIRRTLLLALIGTLLLVGGAAGIATFLSARSQANDLFDEQLRQVALSLRRHAVVWQDELQEQSEYDVVVQVRDGTGSIIVSSRAPALPPEPQGWGTTTVDGQDWRVFTLADANETVQVAQPMSVRNERAANVALRQLTPLLASLPLLALLVWLIVGQGLRPLSRIADDIHRRTPGSLDPLPAAGLPSEIVPMVVELNGLLARLRDALDAQRRFTADAAHELRTPLSALQLQLQLIERAATPDERQQALGDLKAGAARAARLVEQLLALARSDPSAQHAQAEIVELDALVAEVVAGMETLAAARRQALRLERLERADVQGNRAALRTLIENLVENALRHSPAGGRVDVSVHELGGMAVLEVSDTGPGIPASERERVFERFYRPAGTTAPGSGLGLSIVRNVANAHGAKVELLDAEGGGLLVRVTFRSTAA
jgi:two-component system OmpR family sensor kinase